LFDQTRSIFVHRNNTALSFAAQFTESGQDHDQGSLLKPNLLEDLANQAKIHPITSLRFLAALWVVFFHTVHLPFPGIKSSILGRVISLDSSR
jgi:hypothetical protein